MAALSSSAVCLSVLHGLLTRKKRKHRRTRSDVNDWPFPRAGVTVSQFSDQKTKGKGQRTLKSSRKWHTSRVLAAYAVSDLIYCQRLRRSAAWRTAAYRVVTRRRHLSVFSGGQIERIAGNFGTIFIWTISSEIFVHDGQWTTSVSSCQNFAISLFIHHSFLYCQQMSKRIRCYIWQKNILRNVGSQLQRNTTYLGIDRSLAINYFPLNFTRQFKRIIKPRSFCHSWIMHFSTSFTDTQTAIYSCKKTYR